MLGMNFMGCAQVCGIVLHAPAAYEARGDCGPAATCHRIPFLGAHSRTFAQRVSASPVALLCILRKSQTEQYLQGTRLSEHLKRPRRNVHSRSQPVCADTMASHVHCACGRPRKYDGESCAVRLQAAPEMGYDPFSDPPRGEICIKGPMVFAGYYKMPDKTKEEFGGRNPQPAAQLLRDCHQVCQRESASRIHVLPPRQLPQMQHAAVHTLHSSCY